MPRWKGHFGVKDCFELKALRKQRMHEGHSDLPDFSWKVGYFHVKAVLPAAWRKGAFLSSEQGQGQRGETYVHRPCYFSTVNCSSFDLGYKHLGPSALGALFACGDSHVHTKLNVCARLSCSCVLTSVEFRASPTSQRVKAFLTPACHSCCFSGKQLYRISSPPHSSSHLILPSSNSSFSRLSSQE